MSFSQPTLAAAELARRVIETVRDWEARFAPLLAEHLRAKRRGQVGRSWYVDETYAKVNGRWLTSGHKWRSRREQGTTARNLTRSDPAGFGVSMRSGGITSGCQWSRVDSGAILRHGRSMNMLPAPPLTAHGDDLAIHRLLMQRLSGSRARPPQQRRKPAVEQR